MKIKPALFFGFAALAIIAMTIISIRIFQPKISEPENEDVLGFRMRKNQILKTKVDAPFYGDAAFDSLKYFPINPKERYQSEFYPIKNGEEIDLMPDRPGYASHVVKGFVVLENSDWRDTLFLLKELEAKQDSLFFIPFSDASTGKSTYGGGRYLNVLVKPGRPVIIDFNYAYNPWCAYKESFICAKTPFFNDLSKAIEAGEKTY